MDQKIKDLVKYAEAKGIKHFVFGTTDGTLHSTHFNDIPLNLALELVMRLFFQVMELGLQHKDHTPEQKALFGEMAETFKKTIKEYNAKFEKVKVKQE